MDIICTWIGALLLSPSYISFPTYNRSNRLWGVLACLPLRLGVNEATTAAGRLCRARAAHSRRAVAAQLPAETEEDGGQEVGSHRSPCKAHEVAADVGIFAGRAESIATLDDPGAACMLAQLSLRHE